jgi:hypothetical protein
MAALDDLMKAKVERLEFKVNDTTVRVDPDGLAMFANVFLRLAAAGHLHVAPKRRTRRNG